MPDDQRGGEPPDVQAAFPYHAWVLANQAAALQQQEVLSFAQAKRVLGIDYSQPGSVMHIGPGERLEIVAPPDRASAPALCDYCGSAYVPVDGCPGCGNYRPPKET